MTVVDCVHNNLTKAHAILYNVHMVERTVQDEERNNAPTSGSVADVPAPMVERAFRLLDLLVVAEEGLPLSEMARALKMSKGSMHGLLKTLECCGVVEQHENRLYALGPRIYNLAAFIRSTGLRRLALPAMQRLAASIGETIFLGRVEQSIVRVIESVEAGNEHPFPHISVPRGTRVHLLAGASGRLVLACWPVEQRRAWLQAHPLPRFTSRSITDPEQFLQAVEEAARINMGIDHGEYLPGVNAVAVPIVEPDGSLVAILCALGFDAHFNDEVMQHAGQLLKAEAESISRSLVPYPHVPQS
jgi:DNA-binding IclR family transcriptional regulator